MHAFRSHTHTGRHKCKHTYVCTYLFLKQCEASICCCRLFPLLLANRLEAALEVLLLLVQTFSPTLHILCNLTDRQSHCQLSLEHKHGDFMFIIKYI